MSVLIRTEMENDYTQVNHVNFAAFGNRNDEANLVERIRNTSYFVPELSIVAELNEKIVGHILLSKAEVVQGNERYEVIVLAPIAVHPHYQKQGIGTQLINEGLRICNKLGFYYIFLIGHPTYYPKFGFKPARNYGFELIQFKVPDEVFMVYELKENITPNIQGELKYPSSFL